MWSGAPSIPNHEYVDGVWEIVFATFIVYAMLPLRYVQIKLAVCVQIFLSFSFSLFFLKSLVSPNDVDNYRFCIRH